MARSMKVYFLMALLAFTAIVTVVADADAEEDAETRRKRESYPYGHSPSGGIDMGGNITLNLPKWLVWIMAITVFSAIGLLIQKVLSIDSDIGTYLKAFKRTQSVCMCIYGVCVYVCVCVFLSVLYHYFVYMAPGVCLWCVCVCVIVHVFCVVV
jgi:hypothetical protein